MSWCGIKNIDSFTLERDDAMISMSNKPTLNEKIMIEQHTIEKTHKFNVLRFEVKMC